MKRLFAAAECIERSGATSMSRCYEGHVLEVIEKRGKRRVPPGGFLESPEREQEVGPEQSGKRSLEIQISVMSRLAQDVLRRRYLVAGFNLFDQLQRRLRIPGGGLHGGTNLDRELFGESDEE